MSYTVLARRYRSGTFDEVVGQGHVAQTLKKAIASDRIAHAYLFCGTRGTGKTSMARILAKALNCQTSDKPTTEPCRQCESCKGVARGDDMDVVEIDAASNTGVDNVRDLIENSRYSPARSRFKVYIIDEVHALSKNAFNALLKTLEEPPGHVKFILATTEAEKVLPTILSRCQRYDFRNIPTREIAEHLKNVCAGEKIDADADALLLVAKAGAGSMRDALSLLDRLLSIGEKTLTIETIEQLLGMPRTQSIYDFVQKIGEGDVKGVLETGDKLIQSGLSPDTLLASVTDHLRNLLVLRTCGKDSNLVEVPGLGLDDLDRQAQQFDAVVLTQNIAILEELRRQIRVSQSGRALLDATLVRITLAEQFQSLDELIGRVDGYIPSAPSNRPKPVQKKKFDPVNRIVEPVRESMQVNDDSRPATGAVAESVTKNASTPPTTTVTASADAASTDMTSGDVDPAGATSVATKSGDVTPLDGASVGGASVDEDDSLPAVGKVWEGGSQSLTMMFKRASASLARPVSPDPSVEPIVGGEFSDLMGRLVASLEEKGPAWPPLVKNATMVGVADGIATFRYPSSDEMTVKMLDRNGKKEIIQQVLSDLMRQPIGIRAEIDPNPPEVVSAAAPPPPLKPSFAQASKAAKQPPAPEPGIRLTPELKEQLKSDPLIAAVIRELGGEIIKVEEAGRE